MMEGWEKGKEKKMNKNLIGGGTYLGIGAVYNSYFDCDEDVYSSCTETYPEIVISVAF